MTLEQITVNTERTVDLLKYFEFPFFGVNVNRDRILLLGWDDGEFASRLLEEGFEKRYEKLQGDKWGVFEKGDIRIDLFPK